MKIRAPHLEETLELMTLPKTSRAYREISPLLPDLFVFSHMSNTSLLSGKTKSSEKGIEEIYFHRKRIDREF